MGAIPEGKIRTYSRSVTHSETHEVGVVYDIVVGKTGSLWTPRSPLKQINTNRVLVPSICQ